MVSFLRSIFAVVPFLQLVFSTPTGPAQAVPSNASILSSPRCVNKRTWITSGFRPQDCYTTVARFNQREALVSGDRPFEFLAPATQPRHHFLVQLTPKKYYYNTCTLAVMMLKSFNPRDLDLPSTATYPGYDVTSFAALWVAAAYLSHRCISPVLGENDTGTPGENFASSVGWSFAGIGGAMGVFLWDTESHMEQITSHRHLPSTYLNVSEVDVS